MANTKGRQKFGGNWTEEKLEMVRKYLVAYSTIMNKQNFKFAYVDAFAGTGYREQRKTTEAGSVELLFSDSIVENETQDFMEGSAQIALKVEPPFNTYIFIEKSAERFKKLEKLKSDFQDKSDKIKLENEDANTYLKKFCRADWKKHRAVVFLDPFGMQVSWDTICGIAATKAIDLWILFPLGSGVSRLLRRDGQIPQNLKDKLNTLFGEESWYEEFYKKPQQTSLFGDDSAVEKVADFNQIAAYFVSRLKTIFPHVHETPLQLLNSKKVPLFLLCFAASNDKGGKVALKIANDILRSGNGE